MLGRFAAHDVSIVEDEWQSGRIHENDYGTAFAATEIDDSNFRIFGPVEPNSTIDVAGTGPGTLIGKTITLCYPYVSELLFPRRKRFRGIVVTLVCCIGLRRKIILRRCEEGVCDGRSKGLE